MQERYILEKCEISELNITQTKLRSFIEEIWDKYSDREYLYWDKIKYQNLPSKVETHKELWGFIKFARTLNYESPIKTEKWESFRFWELPFSKELFHELDKNASWIFSLSSDSDRKIFIANGMLEEAISSSQIEWAATTTKNAKKMLQQGRKPRNDDEQMIFNNYEAMLYIKNSLVHKKLELSDLLYLQSILTKDTLENKDEVGRFRTDRDQVVVEYERKIAHNPMIEGKMLQEIHRLINFANNEWDFWTFVHPIIRAIIIHFWIGYLHPFCDGNGRTARALFYWYVLKNDYFGFSYMPLSSAIKNSKKEYAKAYIYSEQDELDLNYFINYNLKKIQISLETFKKELKEKFKNESQWIKKLSHLWLNERQIKLINYFLEKKDSYTTPTIHKRYYNISKPTSISDLKFLEKKGFIYSVKSWRNTNYFPVDNLEKVTKKDS